MHEILQSGTPIHALNRFFAVPDPSNPGPAPEIPEAEAQRLFYLDIHLLIPSACTPSWLAKTMRYSKVSNLLYSTFSHALTVLQA